MLNHNNGSVLLLQWINQERSYQGQTITLYDFQHLKQSGFVYQLLQRVNANFFGPLNHLNFQLQSYFNCLEEYLIEIQGKKLVRAYKKEIIQQQSIEEIIKIVLYLLLQGQQKGDFISRIVAMNVEVQSFLMTEIKRVSTYIQNFVEIKDILAAVERLEEENQLLKDRLKSTNNNNEQLSEEITESRNQKTKIQKQISKYQNEKKQIYQELQIGDMKEYVELYKMIKHQNTQLSDYIHEIEESKKEVEIQNHSMKERISEDYQTIHELNEEVVNLKSHYAVMKDEMNCLSFSCEQQSFDDNVLRENKNIGNVKLRHSLETTCSDKYSMFLSHTFDQEQNSECEQLRVYNGEIMYKLENAFKSITNLTNEVTTLKEEKGKMQKKNVFLQKKLVDLKKEQNRFMKELKKMGF